MDADRTPSPSDLQREYLRAWRKKNPEKVRQYNRDYWRRKAEKLNVPQSSDVEVTDAKNQIN